MPSLRNLAIRPPVEPRREFEAIELGEKNGHPYERRLRKNLLRAWDSGVSEAIEGAAGQIGVDPEQLKSLVAAHLFEHQSVELQADHADKVEREWAAIEHKLVSIMTEEGLDLDLACSRIGLTIKRVHQRCQDDPVLAERLQIAFERGTAKLHSVLWGKALKGSERTGLALLQARDSRFVPTQRIEVTEGQILSSAAFKSVLDRLLRVFSVTVPEGETEDYRRGWIDALKMAQSKAAEELGNG